MKKYFILFGSWLVSAMLCAQSPKTVVVEHLTNTACSICRTKNPAFNQTLSSYPQVLQISIHPSSPYAHCYFSMLNKDENDDRTHYYNAFGYTPVIVLNGKVLAGADPLINNTTLDTALNQTSPIEISASEQLLAPDSVLARIVIRTTGSIPLAVYTLFAGVAEDSVSRITHNGEPLHHNVFQKALTKVIGDTLTLPAIGDSMVFNFSYKVQSIWNTNNTFTFAIIQRADNKQVLNAGKSEHPVIFPSSITGIDRRGFSAYPNPVHDKLFLKGTVDFDGAVFEIHDLAGRKLICEKISGSQIDLSTLMRGVYFLKAGNSVIKVVKD